MQTDDLFSFLDDDESNAQKILTKGVEPENDEGPAMMKKKKRKVAETAAAEQKEEATPAMMLPPSTSNEAEKDGEEPVQKKPRLENPQPVVVDEFETEARREVAASAGLAGEVEAGQRLELRHQACYMLVLSLHLSYFSCRSDIKSPSHQVTHTSRSLSMSPPQNLLAFIRSL